MPTRADTRSALLLACCLLLPGCTQWYYDLGEHLVEQDLPVPADDTNLGEVMLLLGPPQRMSATETGFVAAWEHWNIHEMSIGVSLGALGADFFSVDWGEMRAKGEFVLMNFDHEHRLISTSYSEWDNYGGGGQAIQPFIGLVSVVDAGDLVRRMPQHRWGASNLQELPESLNRDSDPYSGQSGIEQRGTPTNVGQRSLEFD